MYVCVAMLVCEMPLRPAATDDARAGFLPLLASCYIYVVVQDACSVSDEEHYEMKDRQLRSGRVFGLKVKVVICITVKSKNGLSK